MRYTFITEDGTVEMSYADYLKNHELMAKVHTDDPSRVRMFLGLRVVSIPKKVLKQDRRRAMLVLDIKRQYEANRLKFFLPHCASTNEFDSVGHRFINDTESILTAIHSGNRYGKTTIAYAKALLTLGGIPTDPNWPCFKEHGIKYVPWTGPKEIAIVSYELINHQNTIWPQVIQVWTPTSELGIFKQRGKTPNWKGNPQVLLDCGTRIYFLYCTQSQAPFESQALDIVVWDEQGQREKFIGANERVSQRMGRHIFSITPHKVKGRPDTGAGAWIHKLYTGEETFGLSVKFYQASFIKDAPDWIYPESVKADKIRQWETEPKQRQDLRVLREGRARLYGEFHVSSGLVYDDWDESLHIINPFPIPKHWTRYRAIDHGRRNLFACLCAAVSPENDCVIYDEILVAGGTVSEKVERVVAQCGNKLRGLGALNLRGVIYERRKEVMCGSRFFRTVMDSRSFSRPEESANITLAQLYNICGLSVCKASGKMIEIGVELASEWLRIDPNREHIQTKQKGAPRVYVFSTLKEFRSEIVSYVESEDRRDGTNPSEIPKNKNDHVMDAFRYLMQSNPVYVAGFGEATEEWEQGERLNEGRILRDKWTGR